MFYPARMDRIGIGVHQSWRDDLLSSLHRMGEVEILDLRTSSFASDILPLPAGDPSSLNNLTRTSFHLNQIIETFHPFLPEQPSA